MNPFIFFVILMSFFTFSNHNQNNFPAFKYNLLLPYTSICFNTITACPAFTKPEKIFNDRVSFTGNSLFLRELLEEEQNTKFNICEKPVEPGILYNSFEGMYEIGYELYYEQGKLEWRDGDSSFSSNSFRRVNITRNYEVIEIEADRNLTFNGGSSKLIFHWESVLSIASLGDNIQIELIYDPLKRIKIELKNDALRSKCEDYNSPQIDMQIYISSEGHSNSTKTKNTTLPNLENLVVCDTRSYGSLELSQIIPLWYFGESWAKAASCSHMNMIPVWKCIADSQLKKVDLYMQAVIRKIPDFMYYVKGILFGASGVLTFKNQTDIDPDQQPKMYLVQDSTQGRRVIPIPKIIFRIISVNNVSFELFNAVVVIHNDPNPVSDDERICQPHEELSGWETIVNRDSSTGLTYLCDMNTFMKKVPMLKKSDVFMSYDDASTSRNYLELHLLAYFDSSYSYTAEFKYKDGTYAINQEFESLLSNYTSII